jgi:hypothetical protein
VTTARKAEPTRTHTSERAELLRRENRANRHEFVADPRVGFDGCRLCGGSFENNRHWQIDE